MDCSASANGDGTTAASAWNSLASLQSHTFVAGDTIRLRRGSECHGTLEPKGSGTAAQPIRLTAYGEGDRPRIVAGNQPTQAVKLFNQQYWDIDSLDISGGNLFGVFVSGDQGILHHIHLTNLVVHDVFGGEMKHKESGLVVIVPGSVKQHFDDVLVDGVTAYNTNQWMGIDVGGGNFGFPPEETWSTNVIIRNSVVHDVQGDGIVLFRVRKGLIDSTVAWRTGLQLTQSIGTPNAIWTWMCHDCVVSNSEAFLTDSPGVDGGAFDIDYGNTNNSVLNSFGHDTMGYCVAVFGAGFVTHTSVVRDNVCIDNGRSPRLAAYQGAIFLLTWNNGVIEDVAVEGNTVYWNPPVGDAAVLNNATLRGTATFTNNTIYSTSPSLLTSNTALTFSNNRYFYYGTQPLHLKYGERSFEQFKGFQQGAQQDSASAFTQRESLASVPAWFNDDRTAPQLSKAAKPRPSAREGVEGPWLLDCSLPVTLQESGLLDAAALRQLTIFKSIAYQYAPRQLKIVVHLHRHSAGEGSALQTALHDLRMAGVDFEVDGHSAATARTTLSAPDGAALASWDGFAGPTQVGVTVRKALGTPDYPQMEAAKNE